MNWIKTSGILLSYFFVVFGVYILNWSVSAIFWAYYIELIILILFYVIIRTLDKWQNPGKYRKLPSAFNIFFASLPLLAIQYLFLSYITSTFAGEGVLNLDLMLKDGGGWVTFLVLAIVYLIRALSARSVSKIEFELQQNFFLEILALSGTNMLGAIAASYVEFIGTISILILMTMGRIAIELYFNYKTKWI